MSRGYHSRNPTTRVDSTLHKGQEARVLSPLRSPTLSPEEHRAYEKAFNVHEVDGVNAIIDSVVRSSGEGD